MSVVTPVAGSREDSVVGDLRMITATFSSIGNGDTWTTGFGVTRSISIDSGNAVPVGGTFSGGQISFSCVGTASNVSVVAFGY